MKVLITFRSIYLPLVMHIVAHGDDDTGTLVAGDAERVGVHVDAEGGPLVVQKGLVRGAEARPGYGSES